MATPAAPIAVVEQDLDDQTTHGVSHEDGWLIQLSYDGLIVFYDLRYNQSLDRGWVLVERFDLCLKAWVCGSQHAVSLVLEVLDPLLPLRGVTQRPWINTMVSGAAGSGMFSVVIEALLTA